MFNFDRRKKIWQHHISSFFSVFFLLIAWVSVEYPLILYSIIYVYMCRSTAYEYRWHSVCGSWVSGSVGRLTWGEVKLPLDGYQPPSLSYGSVKRGCHVILSTSMCSEIDSGTKCNIVAIKTYKIISCII